MLSADDAASPFEVLLPLSLIREHIADDDTERFSEAQLDLYREAAFEACEQYTGITLIGRGLRQVEETLSLRSGFSLGGGALGASGPGFHRLREPATLGLVSVTSPAGTQQIQIAAGSDRLPLAKLDEVIPFGGRSCEFGRPAARQSYTAVYMTGDERPRRLAAGLRLGMLKFIAWSVTNAGDTVVTVTGSMSASRETQQQYGTNNVAIASGALDLWRQYVRSAAR